MLATAAEFKTFLGLQGSGEDASLALYLENTEAILATETGRAFADSDDGAEYTDEPYDGSGSGVLYLVRRAASVTSVKIGVRVATPDATVEADDLAVDAKRLVRLDGGRFPCGVRNVFVTYTGETVDQLSASDLAIARAGLLEGAAFLWRRRGREHVTSETQIDLAVSVSLVAQMERLPAWQRAVNALRDPVFA